MLTQYAVGPELEQKGCGGLRGLAGLCKNERKRSNKQKKKKKVLKGEFFRGQEGFGGSHLGEVSVYESRHPPWLSLSVRHVHLISSWESRGPDEISKNHK